MAKVVELNKLMEFSQKQGLLSAMEDRRRVKKDVLKTSNFNIVLICLESGQKIPSHHEPCDINCVIT